MDESLSRRVLVARAARELGRALLAALCVTATARAQAPVQVRVPRVDGQPISVTRFTVSGRTATNPALEYVALRRGEMLAARTGREATVLPARGDTAVGAPPDLRATLPVEFVAVSATGDVLRYRPVAEVEGGAARYDPSGRVFRGTVRVGLEAVEGTPKGPLPRPVEAYVISDADETVPADLRLERVGPPFVPVRLAVAAPGDALTLRVRTGVDTRQDTVRVPVERPRLVLDASPRQIQGLGLQVSDIVVQAEGLVSYGSTAVRLSADRGSLDSLVISLNQQGIGRSYIRSVGLGEARIRAASPSFQGASTSVVFLFPIGYILAALVGGLIGSAIRECYAPRNRKSRGADFAPALAVGLLVGVLVAVAWAVGVNVLAVSPAARAGEAAVFVMAALGALAGHKVLPVGAARP